MKAYTDLEQSKKLAKILPLESADMSFVEKGNAKHTWYDAENTRITTPYEKKYYVPCWSLAALLDVIEDNIKIEKLAFDLSGIFTYSIIGDGYDYRTCEHEELVDACYEMIVKLHELNLLVIYDTRRKSKTL